MNSKEELKILKKYFAISLEQVCTAHEEIKDCGRIIHEDMTYHIMFIEQDVYKEYGFDSDIVTASITKEEYETLKRWIDDDK